MQPVLVVQLPSGAEMNTRRGRRGRLPQEYHKASPRDCSWEGQGRRAAAHRKRDLAGLVHDADVEAAQGEDGVRDPQARGAHHPRRAQPLPQLAHSQGSCRGGGAWGQGRTPDERMLVQGRRPDAVERPPLSKVARPNMLAGPEGLHPILSTEICFHHLVHNSQRRKCSPGGWSPKV